MLDSTQVIDVAAGTVLAALAALTLAMLSRYDAPRQTSNRRLPGVATGPPPDAGHRACPWHALVATAVCHHPTPPPGLKAPGAD